MSSRLASIRCVQYAFVAGRFWRFTRRYHACEMSLRSLRRFSRRRAKVGERSSFAFSPSGVSFEFACSSRLDRSRITSAD